MILRISAFISGIITIVFGLLWAYGEFSSAIQISQVYVAHLEVVEGMIFGTLFGISALLNVAFLGYRRFELSLATSAFIAFLYVIAALNAPMIF